MVTNLLMRVSIVTGHHMVKGKLLQSKIAKASMRPWSDAGSMLVSSILYFFLSVVL